MDAIHILDVATLDKNEGIWYEQRTTGRTPGSRVDFCLVLAIAPDKSSYNM